MLVSLYLSLSLVIIPLLGQVAADNNHAANITRRRDVATILLEAYTNISGCCILAHNIMGGVSTAHSVHSKVGGVSLTIINSYI